MSTETKSYPLIGFTAPRYMGARGTPGGFVILIFGSVGTPLIAVATGGRVSSFVAVDVSPASILTNIGPFHFHRCNLGDTPSFGFEHIDGSLCVGDHPTIVGVVRNAFRTMSDKPFSQLEMARFITSPLLYEQALKECARLMDEGRPGAGARFIEQTPWKVS